MEIRAKFNISGKFIHLIGQILFLLYLPCKAEAYIGPGAGFAVAGSFMAMFIAIILALFTLFSWPVRYVIRAIRGRKTFSRSKVRRIVILGLDGLDPDLVERFIEEGKLPNFDKLRNQGCFRRLETTIPSISPVAWSSFQTGVNPGKHNIFDFLKRDKITYQPILSSVDIRAPRRKMDLGNYQFPLGKANIRLLRKAKPFWNILGEHGIFSSVIRVPITFPPEKFSGVQLSAMCVPDLRGTQGMFSFYTTQKKDQYEKTGGETFFVIMEGDTIKAELPGPDNPFRKDNKTLKLPFIIVKRDEESVDIRINGITFTLNKGIYSEWVKVSFKAVPGIRIRGICKFLLLNVTPDFELYVTPINIDPEKPAMPISHPSVYSTYFAKLIGSYATLGLAEDTWALNEKILGDEDFISQCIRFDEEREKMFVDSLDKVRQGLCVCVFDGTDRIQHTFWRYIDDHPINFGQRQKHMQHRGAIEEVYKRMDTLVGKTLAKCNDKDTVFMVISDHGFTSFRYGIDLNRWLEENGYLSVKNGKRDGKHLSSIDWSRTRAFAIGLAGIYLNIKGRESKGIVDPGEEADLLRKEIIEKLTGLRDTIRDNLAINQVYNALEVYRGPYKDDAPDLIIGYNRGYRASWETAIGQVTEDVFHENTKAWSGDHCVDPSLVPGVLFCNRPIADDTPRLMDIGPTVLDMFGIDVPGYMDGRPLDIKVLL
ncbi:conserved membrane hypothetical protein [uncultured Desulfobacterium sp.]|uniref:Type I phosphodiesterase/nucleotide pyrophosphatase n=1 Tax=uncultured Desulfobacterium sp. TaxID=201089 RepID=A0A445MUE8_9BACT|nr:conserved membrane hypothetical protein [uncultured Desulfobacterium sp.]